MSDGFVQRQGYSVKKPTKKQPPAHQITTQKFKIIRRLSDKPLMKTEKDRYMNRWTEKLQESLDYAKNPNRLKQEILKTEARLKNPLTSHSP